MEDRLIQGFKIYTIVVKRNIKITRLKERRKAL